MLRKRRLSFKNILVDSIKNLTNLVPHFRNHQIILAKKLKTSMTLKEWNNYPKNEWIKYRLKKLGY